MEYNVGYIKKKKENARYYVIGQCQESLEKKTDVFIESIIVKMIVKDR